MTNEKRNYKGYEVNGVKLDPLAWDGFVNSNNPEKNQWLDELLKANDDPKLEMAIVQFLADSWGVNGENTFNVVGVEGLVEYLK